MSYTLAGKTPLTFERNKHNADYNEFIDSIENEVNHHIIELFLSDTSNPIPFYFFPIANSRHFFFHLIRRIIDYKSINLHERLSVENFSSEIQRFYGGDEWVYSSIQVAKEKLKLGQSQIDKYQENLDKANDKIRSSRGKSSPPAQMFNSQQFKKSTVTLLYGDISKCESDIIVSSDDILLMMNAGVAGAIRVAGGGQIIQDVQKFNDKFPLSPSTILITNAGRLKTKYIFHAAILNPKSTNQKFGPLVKKSVSKCLNLMKEMGCLSITFPLLSSGTAGFGPKESADSIFKTIKKFLLDHPDDKYEIAVCVFDISTINNNNLERDFKKLLS